jgi:hypothetical protein
MRAGRAKRQRGAASRGAYPASWEVRTWASK